MFCAWRPYFLALSKHFGSRCPACPSARRRPRNVPIPRHPRQVGRSPPIPCVAGWLGGIGHSGAPPHSATPRTHVHYEHDRHRDDTEPQPWPQPSALSSEHGTTTMAVGQYSPPGGARQTDEVAEMPTGSNGRKRTTAADIAAAVALGAIAGDTVIVTDDEDAPEHRTQEAHEYTGPVGSTERVALSTTTHDCAIPGCRHGNAHPEHSQPDRQVKLECPGCGAVARMTARALQRSGHLGINCNGCNRPFAVAARRAYNRQAV